MKQQIKSSLILLLTATIWGVAFVAQSVGMEYIGPLPLTQSDAFWGTSANPGYSGFKEKERDRSRKSGKRG